ncbi:hypothetical protein POL68_41955 [Stigmatella sp. ncwal1]|uniref:Fungal lipase-like domain-containing protein n=1 Tax=Stigmatella ashevillensis TaxID=2995309 RepID=A0ABT5DN57_9BACT|nr:hypothetical protein [Stigmatella ashevillena]MDC0715087.1 hypothetical protein [Stigmatella ashevillena]
MSSTVQPLNLCQKTYLLTYESNGLGDSQGDESTLAQKLGTKLTKFLALPDIHAAMEGQWSLAWGPAVFESQPSKTSYADNVMYVAASPDKSVYVVAIAGTNMSSDYDQKTEDLSVNTTKLWTDAFPSLKPYGVPSGINPWPVVSTGTALGVNALLGMKDPATQKSLVDFLRSLSATDSKTLIFGGHSLGGALAPTLALALFNPSGGPFSTGKWGHVYVLPVAGPTPGNQGLSEFFKQVFPPVSLNLPQSYYAWNQNIWNSLDAIPHAWVVDMLKQIPTLYPAIWDGGQVPSNLTNQVNGAVLLSQLGGALPGPYTQLPNIEVPGIFNPFIFVHDYDSFFAQVGFQHVIAYEILFGILTLTSEDTRSSFPRILKRQRGLFLARGGPATAERP